MIKLSQQVIDKLVRDPDFERIEEFIVEYFNNSTDINSIKSDLPSDVVHAQVLAKQEIDKLIKNLINYFVTCREMDSKKNKVSYR